MSITVQIQPWTTDPSMIASGLAIAGAAGTWILGRILSFLGLADEVPR